MAIFLSKRLLRFCILVGVCLTVVLFMSSNSDDESSSKSYLGSLMPKVPFAPDFSSGSLFGWSQTDESLTEKEKETERERQKAEESLALAHKNPNAVPLTEQEMDGEAKALKDAAEASKSTIGYQSTLDFMAPSYANKGKRPKACFVVLVRNMELYDILSSIKYVETRFNNKFTYPWVFLNDEPFTEEFKTKIREAISSEAEFDIIPKEQWSYPASIDQEKAAVERKKMQDDDVIYADSESYRHMCRFQSGFFWRQKLMEKYDWYWRVEPNIKIYCDINYDVFQYMQDNGKAYGFTITIHEYERTIETLWSTTKAFLKKNPEVVDKNNLMKFISEDKGNSYNLCHFWSNFEIANLNFWRSPAYKAYFEYLDSTGGFFYERWGDAPVHSIAASLFLPKDTIHYFSDIGYHHVPYDNCPLDNAVYAANKCDCNQDNDFTFQGYACGRQYYDAQGMKKPAGWEKFQN